MNKWTRPLFAATMVLSLLIPVSAQADETNDPHDSTDGFYDYVDEPFQKYLEELNAQLEESEYQQEISGDSIDKFLEELREQLESDEISGNEYREQLYQWLKNNVPGFDRH